MFFGIGYGAIWIQGMDLLFELDEVDAFVRQPDGSLFSWSERFRCYHYLIYGIVSDFSHGTWFFPPCTYSINYTIVERILTTLLFQCFS